MARRKMTPSQATKGLKGLKKVKTRVARAAAIPSEASEQRALVKWLNLSPILRDFYCKIDNEGSRTPAQGFHAKLLGLRRGVSDLFIYYPCNGKHGIWLEMKRKRTYSRSERLTETWIAQEKFQECVKKVGFEAYFCYGWEDAIKTIENYLLNANSLKALAS